MWFEKFLNLKLIVVSFYLFSFLCFFLNIHQKNKTFKISDDRPFAVDLQYIGVSYVPYGQLRDWDKFGRKTNMLFVTRSHIDMIIILYLFPSGLYLAWYFKKKTSTNVHENFSFLVPLEKKKTRHKTTFWKIPSGRS